MPETMMPDTMMLDTGDGQLSLILPAGFDVEVLRPNAMAAAPDAVVEIQRALAGPIGSRRLSLMARSGMKVALIVCDDTRYAPQKLIIPAIAAELQSAGVQRSDITIIIACGTHEAMGKEAIVHMLGPEIPQAYRVVNHDAYDEADLVHVGVSRGLGVPIVLNRIAVEADLRIGIGAVDPHIFAGYSGGAKILSVGVAGRDTIAGTHNPRVMEDPGTRYGVIEGNTFRAFLDEVASLVPLDFIVNVVQDTEKRLIRAFAGHAREAWKPAVALARELNEVMAEHEADIVVSVPKYPKSINLYQAIRAANPVVFGKPPLIKQGGILIIPARCPRGVGSDEFEDDMASAADAASIIEKGRAEGFGPEGNKSFTVAKVLSRCSVVFTDTDLPPETLARMKLGWEADASKALATAAFRTGASHSGGRGRIAILPDGFSILPRLEPRAGTQE
ncbi:MAG: nickel-dependent lactate racemase [Rectinemataceae bacterium]